MLLSLADAPHLKPWLIRTLEPICDADPVALADYIIALIGHESPEADMRKDLESQLEEFLERETAQFINALFTVLRTKSYLPYADADGDVAQPIPIASTSQSRGTKRSYDQSDSTRDERIPKGPRIASDRTAASWDRSRPPPNQPRPRAPCRDYHQKGFCSRGATCKWSHGEDAFVPGQMFPPMPMQFSGPPPPPPMYQNDNGPYSMDPNKTYNPNEPQMDIARSPVDQRHMQDGLPMMTPEAMHAFMQQNAGMLGFPPGFLLPGMMPPNGHSEPQGGRNGRRGRGGGPPGTFGEEARSKRPGRKSDITLVVEKIPTEKLNLDSVNSWFKQFGTVTNVAVDARGAKALVSFSTHDEAQAAWKSEEAVFGNRFVKVLWHRPLEGQGQAGAKSLEASKSLVANLNGAAKPKESSASPAPAPPLPPKRSASEVAALATKQRLLEKQIAEQKILMAQLGSANAERKREIMARLRQLGEEMKNPETPVKAASPTPDAKMEDATGEDTEDLKAKLAKLKAEAAELGLPEANGRSASPARGRGRGRGRPFFRGAPRGGPPRGSMKLDNRTKKLVVKGASADQLASIRTFYEASGQVDTVERTDSDTIVSFKTRNAAEQALAQGRNIPSVGEVEVGWFNDGSSTLIVDSSPGHSSPTSSKYRASSPTEPKSPRREDAHEDPSSSGWGNDDGADDGMGMM